VLEFWKHLDEKSLSMNSGSCFTKETSCVRVDSELCYKEKFPRFGVVFFFSLALSYT